MKKRIFINTIALLMLTVTVMSLVSAPTAGSTAGLASAPWPMFQHDPQNTGRSPYNGPDQPQLKWTFTTGAPVHPSPVIGTDGTIYVGSKDNLYAINPDGTEKWHFTTGSYILGAAAVAADGTIYVASRDSYLYAINPDGNEKWHFKTGDGIHGSPVIGADGTIYVGSWDNNLYAINPDGTEKWHFTTGHDIYGSPAVAADGTIYIGSEDNNLYAINPDGTEKWHFIAGREISSPPAIGTDGTIYVGSWDNNLYAINPDGTEKWRFTTGDSISSSPAIGADNTIYVGSRDNKLYAVNLDGAEKWHFATNGDIHSSPAIGADGTIYVGSFDKNIYAINSDGTEKWRVSTGDRIVSSPAVGSGNTLYVGSHDNMLYAVGLNMPPIAQASVDPYLAPLGLTFKFDGRASYDPDGAISSFEWDFDDGSLSSGSTTTHIYETPGVYNVTLTVTDNIGAKSTDSVMVVVYNPEGGFVTGGGWIESPTGAYTVAPEIAGKATFGFVSKYQKGAETPSGETEFQFRVANLNFHSTCYQWLVVAGARAKFKGTGTINKGGNYGFMLTAIDGEIEGGGDTDKFRIKIWDKDSGDMVIYDNELGADDSKDPTTVIGGGSIVIHDK